MGRSGKLANFAYLIAAALSSALIDVHACSDHISHNQSDPISCRDLNGAAVDWFVVYKLPDINEHESPLVNDGVGFLYMDARSTNGSGWQLSSKGINESDSAVGATLQQFYARINDTELYHVMYNDHHPSDKNDAYRGHTKGIQFFDETTGIWLIHSVPKFPHPSHYAYPSSGLRNGQSMLCITFDTAKSMKEISEQLFYYQTSIYSAKLPSTFAQTYPKLSLMVGRKSQLRLPYTRQSELVSLDGAAFTSFAKCKKWPKDLYADLIAPSLAQSLSVETWLNGAARDLLSVCNATNQVHNVRAAAPGGVRFLSTKDHSKWAVSAGDGDWVCVGDINRQHSQDHRAGGAVCFESAVVSAAYKNAVAFVEPCPRNR